MSGKRVVRDVVLAASAAVLVACGSTPVTAGDGPAPEVPEQGVPEQGVPLCGGGVEFLAAPGLLTVTGRFPASVERGAGTVVGAVTVTNTGPPITGDTSPVADVYLAREGKVVVTPMPKDLVAQPVELATGGSAEFPATGALRACAGGEPLPAGTYDVFAVVAVTGGDNTLIAPGGPWRLDVT